MVDETLYILKMNTDNQNFGNAFIKKLIQFRKCDFFVMIKCREYFSYQKLQRDRKFLTLFLQIGRNNRFYGNRITVHKSKYR